MQHCCKGPNRLVSRLQRCCKGQTIWFLVCNDVARPKLFGFSFATMLQGPNRLVSRLQRCCKAQTVWFLVCNVVARPKPFSFSFATLLQGPNRLVSCLQRCCKAQTIWFLVCNVIAELKPFGFLFAELPRSPNHLVFHLRNSREVVSICFLVRASDLLPHSISGFAHSNSGVPPACRDRPRGVICCPHPSGSQNRIHIQKYILRSVDRIGAGIGQTRGLSLRAGPSGPNWPPSILRLASRIGIK